MKCSRLFFQVFSASTILFLVQCSHPGKVTYNVWISETRNVVLFNYGIDTSRVPDVSDVVGFNIRDGANNPWNYGLKLSWRLDVSFNSASIFSSRLPSIGESYSVPLSFYNAKSFAYSNINIETQDSMGNQIAFTDTVSCTLVGISYYDTVTLRDNTNSLQGSRPLNSADIKEKHGMQFVLSWKSSELHGEIFWVLVTMYGDPSLSPL
jgi:hypothetical protein